MKEFDKLPKRKRNSETMMKIVNSNTEFTITKSEAAKILGVEPNAYYVEDHNYLGIKTIPKINDFKEFYVHPGNVRKDILGRVVAKYQNVVWSTGTHTNSLVPIIALGPEQVIAWFNKMMHTTEWGEYTIDVFIFRIAS